MIGITSKSAGVLFVPKTGTNEYAILDLIQGVKQDPIEAQYLYSASQDWEEIEGSDVKSLLDVATREYWIERSVSLLRLAIGGLEEPLEKEVLEHVEELLAARVSSEEVLNRLLIAPLSDCTLLKKLTKTALSGGFSATTSLLEEMNDIQPLLRRLTDHWLALDDSVFTHFSESREKIWLTVVEKSIIKKILLANSESVFVTTWNLMVFHFTNQQSRSGVNVLGRELSRRLFPSKGQVSVNLGDMSEERESKRYDEKKQEGGNYETYMRVGKQINTIAQAVSEGNDANAEKFLRELVQAQTSSQGGEDYAVKSLCNIAQRCACMFRMDFESICLNEALHLNPYDAWTLVQYGDHLKRTGDYDGALKQFALAGSLGGDVVVKSAEADVYSQQGDYEKAILTYKDIPNFSAYSAVLTAIADNYRKMGRMKESEDVYNQLINLSRQGLLEFVNREVRALVGMAEIAKVQGKLEVALQTYYGILKRKDLEDPDRLVYQLGLCNILKLMERFNEAYAIVDDVIQRYPFAMGARFTRGSILGLIGKELDGLKDLPETSGSRSWGEWLRRYYRGLLLLKLERYEDAKKNLIEELPKAIASGEEKSILRMAAALCFLKEDNTSEADTLLSSIPDLYDCHTKYLSLVLKLHSAARRQDIAVMNSLKRQISAIKFVDKRLENAVVAINNGNFPLALTYEADALLKLAA